MRSNFIWPLLSSRISVCHVNSLLSCCLVAAQIEYFQLMDQFVELLIWQGNPAPSLTQFLQFHIVASFSRYLPISQSFDFLLCSILVFFSIIKQFYCRFTVRVKYFLWCCSNYKNTANNCSINLSYLHKITVLTLPEYLILRKRNAQ